MILYTNYISMFNSTCFSYQMKNGWLCVDTL